MRATLLLFFSIESGVIITGSQTRENTEICVKKESPTTTREFVLVKMELLGVVASEAKGKQTTLAACDCWASDPVLLGVFVWFKKNPN